MYTNLRPVRNPNTDVPSSLVSINSDLFEYARDAISESQYSFFDLVEEVRRLRQEPDIAGDAVLHRK